MDVAFVGEAAAPVSNLQKYQLLKDVRMTSVLAFKSGYAASCRKDRLYDSLPDQFRFPLATMRIHKHEQAPSLPFCYDI